MTKSWWKNIVKKATHGIVLGVGSALPMIVTGAVSPVAGAKLAIGAFIAYLLKPARPERPASADAPIGVDAETPKAPR